MPASESTSEPIWERPRCSRRLLLGAGALLAAGLGRSGTAFADSGSSGYAPVDGLKVYYELHGASLDTGKIPIVLLHGGAMSIETAFAGDLLPRFARTRPVIAIEQQGHGHTGDREGPVTIDRMVEDTAGVLAHLKIKQAHLLGHSLGGIIAMGMAIRHADLVASMTPLSAFYNLEGMLPELVKLQRGQIQQPSPALAPLLPTEADFAAWRTGFERDNPDPAGFDRALAKLNQMLADWPGWSEAELRSVRAPTLVAIGDNDFTRIEHAAEMMRLIPGARLAILPGTTHMSSVRRGAWLEPMVEERIAG
ncbi:MAG TPA: alpha/beta hydrolase [Dongiaceae bacterium]|jgi:pimeloyl-ACP methyl ester carboxylesterase|nr:alpha/beta hydrolase [Dongiaceae bacterium]